MKPGRRLNLPGDDGLGPLGTVDRATLSPGLFVSMHEHVDDEILSYLRSGVMHHRDSTNQQVVLSPKHLMLMNSGLGFSHEETIPVTELSTTEMLQIFVRPTDSGLPAGLQLLSLDSATPPMGSWRNIGGPVGSIAPLQLRNEVWVQDCLVPIGENSHLPSLPDHTLWLHVFTGEGMLQQHHMLSGDSVVVENEPKITFRASEDSILVAFVVNRSASFVRSGSLSG
jgi:quercetin 2,3-dioxygenase